MVPIIHGSSIKKYKIALHSLECMGCNWPKFIKTLMMLIYDNNNSCLPITMWHGAEASARIDMSSPESCKATYCERGQQTQYSIPY